MKKTLRFLKNNYYAQKVLPFLTVLAVSLAMALPVVGVCLNGQGLPSLSLVVSFLWGMAVFMAPLLFMLALFIALPPMKQNGKFDKIITYICFGGWCYAVFFVFLSILAVFINQLFPSFHYEETLFLALHQPFICLLGVFVSAILLVVWRPKLFPRVQVPFVKCRGGFVGGFFMAGLSFYLIIFKYADILEKAKQLMQ